MTQFDPAAGRSLSPRRRGASRLIVGDLILVIGLAGCATKPPVLTSPAFEMPAQRAIAVVPAHYAPGVEFETYARNHLWGAIQGLGIGAAAGALVGVDIASGSSCSGCGTVAIAIAATGMVIGGVVGAAAGVKATVPAQTAEGIDHMLNDAAADLDMPALTAQAAVEAATRFGPYRADLLADAGPRAIAEHPPYAALGGRGYGKVIEVRITQLGLTGGGGRDPDLSPFLTAEARLIDTSTGALVWRQGYGYETGARKASAWAQDGAAPLRQAFRLAGASVGERIIESLVLSSGRAWRDDGEKRAGPQACGLRPLLPAPRWSSGAASAQSVTVEMVGLAPVLAWEALDERALPGTRDAARASPAHHRLQDVRYDLRIWRVQDPGTPQLVYERIGLDATVHRVEQPLESRTEYLWSVRPRFVLDGHLGALRWSAWAAPAYLPSTPVKKAVYFANDEGTAAPNDVDPALWTPCALLDFIPLANFDHFRTP